MPRPETPALTVDAVIPVEKNGQPALILIKRKNPPPGWALPGGFVDVGETVETACTREAKEETNLDVEIVRLVGVYSDPARDPRGHTCSIVYVTEKKPGTPPMQAQDDAAEIGVFTRAEIADLPIAFDHRQIIEDAGIW